ncbi:hypothetical protein A4D02_33615 [Niastella koreensis]|uniref:4-fold beta flower domain-containing protein n=2 Tax=Niastella koreensis TaxID=354356 RepID=G8TAG8_NIAKG|nr:hypothetical protein [Niastella koreensis]AEV98130.1 hypothetical protein Niako_1767 [Niastella koreensis GR20-10]OQP45338.1 hypothetical protein A4D02_33615 [Niastella koreensis]
MGLYTKNGRPLQVVNDKIYSKSGKIVGRIKGKNVYGTDGAYVGTIVSERLLYRSTYSGRRSSSFTAGNRMGTSKANRVKSALWGDEPNIPD